MTMIMTMTMAAPHEPCQSSMARQRVFRRAFWVGALWLAGLVGGMATPLGAHASPLFWGAPAGVAYWILDPLAPNWEVELVPMPDDHVQISMKMKRYYNGGAGEARQIFQRRARDLMRYGEFSGYEVREYSEGIDSSLIGSQRVATGIIHLTGRKLPQEPEEKGSAPPALKISDSATNPRS